MKYLDEIRGLPVDERIQLVHAIMETVDADLELTPEWREELDRRFAHLDAHPEDVIPWDQVEAEIFGDE